MEVRRLIQPVTSYLLIALVLSPVLAQDSSAPSQNPARPAAVKGAPVQQVVTVVHRLNGLQMFRILLRAQEDVQAISSLDSAFNLTDDVHTNVIAGLTLGDGQTIVTWLPEAEVELSSSLFPVGNSFPVPRPIPTNPTEIPPPAKPAMVGFPNTPDVTVIGPDGVRLTVEYVGLDAATGLSILRLNENNRLTTEDPVANSATGVGENVRLFAPELASQPRGIPSGELLVRMGSVVGQVENIQRAPTGGVARLKVRSARLSRANIGGVAVNDAGETLGIVDGVEGSEASILPTALVQRAAERVLARRTSVPKPWLGVKGEAVAATNLAQMLSHGWNVDRATSIAGSHRGIFLTSVLPNSPAAKAALRAGDVILAVNDKVIENAEDFTWFLDQAGPSSSVSFTLARPGRQAQELVDVRLSGMMYPNFMFKTRRQVYATGAFSLIDQGVEAIELRPLAAAKWGAAAGLLVVFVEPDTPGSAAGLLPGDVIELINGRSAAVMGRTSLIPGRRPVSYKFAVIRNKQRLTLTLKTPPQK